MLEQLKEEYARDIGFTCWVELLDSVSTWQLEVILDSIHAEHNLTTYYEN